MRGKLPALTDGMKWRRGWGQSLSSFGTGRNGGESLPIYGECEPYYRSAEQIGNMPGGHLIVRKQSTRKDRIMKISLLLTLFFCVALVLPAQSQQTNALQWLEPVTFKTIEQGNISYYRYGDHSFVGADLLIRDRRCWKEFWAAHTAGILPAPPLPSVDFLNEMVMVTLLGYQTTGGGPKIGVLKISIDYNRKLHVFIEDNETPGLLDVITNPFHIIRLKRLPVRSLLFEHQRVSWGQPLPKEE
jgi:hypothetical protein